MRVLVDLGHPAHFHLFRCTVEALRRQGHDVRVYARQKDCLAALLDAAGWEYTMPRRRRNKTWALGFEALGVLGQVLREASRRPFDLMVGTSIVVAPAARLTGATSIVFNEDDADQVPLFSRLAYGPAHCIATPRCLAYEVPRHGSKHLTYQGYQELAYLHPNRFTPDPDIRQALGLRDGQPYFLVRLVALTAHHDGGEKGLSTEQARQVVQRLAPYGQVFVSQEGGLEKDLDVKALPTPSERIFDVLAMADMVVGDSQTIAAEAAVLGTPSLRCNTFVGRLSYLEELEHKYGLTVGIRPDCFSQVLNRIDQWLATPDLRDRWQARRQAMLNDCVDVTDWILDLLHRLAARRGGRCRK